MGMSIVEVGMAMAMAMGTCDEWVYTSILVRLAVVSIFSLISSVY